MQSERTLQPNWQQQLLQSLIELLEGNEDVVALGIRGSFLQPVLLDTWSDVDLLLVVRDNALERFFPALDWLTPLGQIFAYEQLARDNRRTTRICFEDFRRLDVGIATETKLVEAQLHSEGLFPGPTSVLFSRSPAVTDALSSARSHAAFSSPSPPAFEQMTNSFWFKAVVAVTKIVRDDLLIALHLTLELLEDCCILGMMLRDRATGATYHRTGAVGNEVINELPAIEQPYTALRILDAIEKSGATYDRLACEWTDSYRARHRLLAHYVEYARQALEKGGKS